MSLFAPTGKILDWIAVSGGAIVEIGADAAQFDPPVLGIHLKIEVLFEARDMPSVFPECGQIGAVLQAIGLGQGINRLTVHFPVFPVDQLGLGALGRLFDFHGLALDINENAQGGTFAWHRGQKAILQRLARGLLPNVNFIELGVWVEFLNRLQGQWQTTLG